jgi:hypothetical protein
MIFSDDRFFSDALFRLTFRYGAVRMERKYIQGRRRYARIRFK